ncbi:MAG: tetratricopeptide repeat protein [bacterium]|nr:tetratricopeptide repeat protein [bacterium]
MTFEIVTVVILSILLWVLLRHWPDTESDAAPRQQLNTKKPLEEHEGPAMTKNKASWWSKIGQVFKQGYNSVLDWYERLSQNRASKKVAQTATAASNEELPTIAPQADPETAPSGSTDSTLLIAKAEVAQRKGDYERAERLLVKAASLDPKNPKIYSKLGIIYLEQGENFDEAEQSFRQALKYDPNNGYVHNNLGLVLYYQDKFSAAAEEFEFSINQDDQVASRHINLGLAYSSLRQFVKAETCYKRALKFDPNNEEYQALAKEAARRRQAHQQH